jgi:protein-S-isoprenylcysteine O-methyltransferase Ste14
MEELIKAVNEFLLGSFPGSGQIIGNIRPFGYAAFGVTLVLMLLGLIVGKSYPAIAGAITMYLPTFGYFTATMLPLAGIGLLRALWLPLLDVSPSLLRLGDIVYMPFIILVNKLGMSGYIIIETLSSILMAVGVFIFFLGVLTWFYGKYRGCEIVDFWIYMISRHPQYLGLLLWSYGQTLLMIFMPQFSGIWFLELLPEPSFPWLIYALTLVAVALNEETKMTKKYGENFIKYCGYASFMLPLPKIVKNFLMFPVKILFKKNQPDNKKEIACTIFIYAAILISLSAYF